MRDLVVFYGLPSSLSIKRSWLGGSKGYKLALHFSIALIAGAFFVQTGLLSSVPVASNWWLKIGQWLVAKSAHDMVFWPGLVIKGALAH